MTHPHPWPGLLGKIQLAAVYLREACLTLKIKITHELAHPFDEGIFGVVSQSTSAQGSSQVLDHIGFAGIQ